MLRVSKSRKGYFTSLTLHISVSSVLPALNSYPYFPIVQPDDPYFLLRKPFFAQERNENGICPETFPPRIVEGPL